MTINSKGEIVCPVCNSSKKSLVVTYHRFNDLEYYKVEAANNLIVDNYLLKEEIIDLINKGVEVKLK